MYSFTSHTWNPVKGKCGYGCHYCYVGKWGTKQSPIHLDEKEWMSNLGSGNSIFICSGCDLLHPDVWDAWICNLINHTRMYPGNQYLLHTKNPKRLYDLADVLSWPRETFTLCVTVESNRWYEQMGSAPTPAERIEYLSRIDVAKMITIEPVMDFDTIEFSKQIRRCRPVQVNIGADSGGNNLPEPCRGKLEALIALLSQHTKVHLKKNLRRLLPEHRLYNGDV